MGACVASGGTAVVAPRTYIMFRQVKQSTFYFVTLVRDSNAIWFNSYTHHVQTGQTDNVLLRDVGLWFKYDMVQFVHTTCSDRSTSQRFRDVGLWFKYDMVQFVYTSSSDMSTIQRLTSWRWFKVQVRYAFAHTHPTDQVGGPACLSVSRVHVFRCAVHVFDGSVLSVRRVFRGAVHVFNGSIRAVVRGFGS